MAVSNSAIFAQARRLRMEMLTDYRALQEAEYAAADAATRGNMVNRRGRALDWSSWDVLYGSPGVLAAYASDELKEHLLTHPHTTRTTFEREWVLQ